MSREDIDPSSTKGDFRGTT